MKRPYAVSWLKEEKVVPGLFWIVWAHGPKAAVERIAASALPQGEMFGKFRVRPVTDGDRLSESFLSLFYSRTYEVYLDRHVSAVTLVP